MTARYIESREVGSSQGDVWITFGYDTDGKVYVGKGKKAYCDTLLHPFYFTKSTYRPSWGSTAVVEDQILINAAKEALNIH